MQLIQPSHAIRPARGPMLMGTVVGGVLLAGGIVLGWLAFATPFVRVLSPSVVRPTVEEMAIGGFIWGLSLVAPPCFAIVGLLRLTPGRRNARPQARRRGALEGGPVAAGRLRGRAVARAAGRPTDPQRRRRSVRTRRDRRSAADGGHAPPRQQLGGPAHATGGGCRSSIRSSGPAATPSDSGAGSARRSATSS